jgi:hypothetical protein
VKKNPKRVLDNLGLKQVSNTHKQTTSYINTKVEGRPIYYAVNTGRCKMHAKRGRSDFIIFLLYFARINLKKETLPDPNEARAGNVKP